MADAFEWLRWVLVVAEDDEFNGALRMLADGEITLPPRFPAGEYGGGVSHTPITYTVLRIGCSGGAALRLVRLLHERLGFSVDDCTMPDQMSPLALCIENRRYGIAQYLLMECNAQIPVIPPKEFLSDELIESVRMLELFAQRPPPTLVAEIRERRYNRRTPSGEISKITILHSAVKRLEPRTVELLVCAFRADPDARDSHGQTPEEWIDAAALQHSDNHADWEERANVIRAFFAGWRRDREQRRLAIGMSQHGRLGSKSPLALVGPDTLASIMQQMQL